MENANSPISLSQAVEAIKTAILQGQYEAFNNASNKPVTIGEPQEQSNFPVASGKLQTSDCQIDIYNTIAIPNIAEFPVEDFFKVPFSHHSRIITLQKGTDARYYYIKRTAEEHLSVEALEKLIKQKTFENQDSIPNNFIKTIPNSTLARKAVMMFKDSYALNFVNVEEIGERDKEEN